MKLTRSALAAALLLCGSPVFAQTAPVLKWNDDKVSWQPPATCEDGSPLTDCPITAYRVETAASATATTWTLVTTTAGTVLSHTLTGVTAGQHCYRVLASSGAKTGQPSNVACDTAEGPAPGPTRAVVVE